MKRSSNQNIRKANPDVRVLDLLKKVGSDLSKVHEIEFFLYFPNSETAENVKVELVQKGFSVEISQAAKGQNWLCLVSKRMVPDYNDLAKLRYDLIAIAEKNNGEYDGWGTLAID